MFAGKLQKKCNYLYKKCCQSIDFTSKAIFLEMSGVKKNCIKYFVVNFMGINLFSI